MSKCILDSSISDLVLKRGNSAIRLYRNIAFCLKTQELYIQYSRANFNSRAYSLRTALMTLMEKHSINTVVMSQGNLYITKTIKKVCDIFGLSLIDASRVYTVIALMDIKYDFENTLPSHYITDLNDLNRLVLDFKREGVIDE